MAQFLAAIQYVLLNEGGFSDDPNDPGGATNFGILQRELPGVDIRTITREQAISFYLPNYWNKALYANIVSRWGRRPINHPLQIAGSTQSKADGVRSRLDGSGE